MAWSTQLREIYSKVFRLLTAFYSQQNNNWSLSELGIFLHGMKREQHFIKIINTDLITAVYIILYACIHCSVTNSLGRNQSNLLVFIIFTVETKFNDVNQIRSLNLKTHKKKVNFKISSTGKDTFN